MGTIAPALKTAQQRVVVVGVDGSINASAALRWAARDVSWLGGRLRIVCAWHPAHPTSPLTAGTSGPHREELAAAAILDAALNSVASPTLQVSGEIVQGLASVVLVASAAAAAADLLVVGARGLEGPRRISLGSVSSRCALRAPCPVVVVPALWSAPGCLAVSAEQTPAAAYTSIA
jgi:nucleotide-binding universal stress UspA family protein